MIYLIQYIAIEAAQKMLQLLENQRIALVDIELKEYEQRHNNYTNLQKSMDKRQQLIIGLDVQTTLDMQKKHSLPNNEAEKQRVLVGELGLLRTERLTSYEKAWLSLLSSIILVVILALLAVWSVDRLMRSLYIRKENNGGVTAQTKVLYDLIAGVTHSFIWLIAVLVILQSMGFNVMTLIAGLSIGGLAVAMASKEAISDIIAGLILLTSQPFKVGDVIKFNNADAKVENINLQFTRLRTLPTNDLVVIPNTLLTNAELINVTASLVTGLRRDINIPLSPCNSVQQVQQALQIVHAVVQALDNVQLAWVRIGSFDEYAFMLQMRLIMIDLNDLNERHAIINKVNTTIIAQFQAQNIKFAINTHLLEYDSLPARSNHTNTL
ncbi:MAG: mechanosensitive ion channel [Mariprofundales bacterium]